MQRGVCFLVGWMTFCSVHALGSGWRSHEFGDIVSIHSRQLEQFRGMEPGSHEGVTVPRRDRWVTHTVYGWYPYWMGDAYLDLDWNLLSHVSFFCLEATSTGAVSADYGWPENWTGLIGTAQAAGVPLTVTCALFDSGAINTLLGNLTYRSNLISNLLQACMDGGAVGVNIDFEGSNLNAGNLVVFMQELRAAFDAVIPGAHISMATPAVDWTGSFDYDQLAVVCDNLIAMCYDYHWSSGNPGPVSPLSAGTMWSQWCVEWTVNDYITYGMPRSKLAIGVPYYGYDWPTVEDPPVYPPPATRNGAYQTGARYYNYIRNNHGGYTKYWDDHSQTPWYYYYNASVPRQVWYDDHVSLGLKYDLVLQENLSGIGIWALGYDRGYVELWDQIESHFGSSVTPTPAPTVTPSPFAVIVDNSDPECEVIGGSWSVGSYGETFGPDKLYCLSGTGSGSVQYSAVLPDGRYSVSAWVNDAGYTTQAFYTVHHQGGQTSIVRSQTDQGGGWCIDLGAYIFDGASAVTITDDTSGGTVVADAVKWVLDEPDTPTPAQPLPATTTSGLVILLLLCSSLIAVSIRRL